MDAVLRVAGVAMQPLMGAGAAILAPTRPAPRPVVLPTAPTPAPPSSEAHTGACLDRLTETARAWRAMSLTERAALLRRCVDSAVKVHRWGGGWSRRGWTAALDSADPPLSPASQASRPAAQAAVAAKGSYGVGVGEEWMGWMAVIWALRMVREGRRETNEAGG